MRRLCPSELYPQPLLSVAGHRLTGASRPEPTEPLSDDMWTSVLDGAVTHRLMGQLWSAIDSRTFPATEIQAAQARAQYISSLLWVLTLENELAGLADLLTGAAIDFRVLKGAAVAHLDYPDPALRSFIDLDLLVRAADFDRTVNACLEGGFVRRLEQPRPGFDRRFDKGTTLVAPAGYELDLHRTFVLGPWGLRVDLDDLWDGGQEFAVAGRSLRALSPVNRLMHACYHAALGDWPLRLASLRDVAEMIQDEHVAQAARARAQRWGAEAVVASAIADASRLLGLPATTPVPAWATQFLPSRRDEHELALHTQPTKTFTAQALSTLRALPGLRDKAAYVRALALPDARYVADRHSSALARFRYGFVEARRGRAGRAGSSL